MHTMASAKQMQTRTQALSLRQEIRMGWQEALAQAVDLLEVVPVSLAKQR